MKKIIITLAFVVLPGITVFANNGNSLQNLAISTGTVSNSQIEDFFKTENFSKIA
jgi:hypothetical protein